MRSVAEHLGECLAAVGPLPPLVVALPDAVGCVLAEDIAAEADLPIVDLAARDGYAVRAEEVALGLARLPAGEVSLVLPVLGDQLPGVASGISHVEGTCVRIASGAPMPSGADAVIPIEHTDHGEVRVSVTRAVEAGAYVRSRGQDTRAGVTVLPRGIRVGARQIAVLAGLGRGRLAVHPRPRVVVVSIGDELIEPGSSGGVVGGAGGARAAAGAVFDANGHALTTAARDADATTFRVAAVPDERHALRETLEDQMVRADVIVTTGGLSYGAGDTVKDVLGPLGTVRFDNVAISPGRQLGVGTVGDSDTPIFCLPGDPVAAQVAFESFVRPALRKMAGRAGLYRDSVEARVEDGWESPAGRRQFVPVRLSGSLGAGYVAEVCGVPGQPLLTALADANAFAVVPENQTRVAVGDRLYCMVLG
ncbi:MAG: molybdopterin molybdotransferase MoeA [Actinomycetaceae bacterium]|nr:molybdopterin molybdotransferase MoeA [Actinomycetaceae bacterium]